MKVKIKLDKGAKMPERKTFGAAGYDIFSNEDVRMMPDAIIPYIIRTGVYVEVPLGYEIQVRSRSGLAKDGIFVVNSPGTIDSDYRGEIKVILYNISGEGKTLNKGDRIAQLVLSKVPSIEFEEITELSETDRGGNGFGSTGR